MHESFSFEIYESEFVNAREFSREERNTVHLGLDGST